MFGRSEPALLLAWFCGVAGCCHVNQLAARRGALRSVGLAIWAKPEVQLRFTRKSQPSTRKLLGPLAEANRMVLRYEQLLAVVAGERLHRSLVDRVGRVLKRAFGWQPEGADAELRLSVDEVTFTAADHLSPVSVTWTLAIQLVDAARGDLLWRDCPQWTLALGAVSMERIVRLGSEGLDDLLGEMAAGLAERLAQRLGEEGVPTRDSINRP